MPSRRHCFCITASFIALNAAGCQLVLPDGGGGNSSTTTTASTGASATTCDAACKVAAMSVCDPFFKAHCPSLCAAAKPPGLECAEKSQTCTANLVKPCGVDPCALMSTVCPNAGGSCKASSPCAAGWLGEAIKWDGRMCSTLRDDACNNVDGSCGDLAAFQQKTTCN